MKKRNMRCKWKKKRWICFGLAVSMMLTLTSCKVTEPAGEDSDTDTENDSAGANGEDAAEASSQTAMGRYVEEETDLSDMLFMPEGIYKRDDGTLVIPDGSKGILISEDQGVTWETEMPDWLVSLLEEDCYISELDMMPDGTFAVLYDPYTDDDYTPVMELILPDGTQLPIELPLADEEDYIREMEVSDEGRLIVRTRGGSLFEIREDGSSELLLELTDYINAFYVKGNLIFMDIADLSGMPMIYDLESGTYAEDDVLTDFVDENYQDRRYNGSFERQMYLLPAQEEVVYLIGSEGIHRHVIGGNMIEQVVDGTLSMLSNPSYTIISAVMTDPETFLVLFAGNKLIRYTYDPNVPAVPEKMLKVYSLHEDATMRQVISYYQSRNTDVFVSYEVGMEEGSAVTREDAIKRLNTEIMAGTGPDLLIMDDMPLASYIEKGMLLDITDYLEECSQQEPLFDNIIDALKVNEKAYIVPAAFSVPIVFGEEKYIENMTELSDIGASVESLRDEHPGDDIIGICDAKDVLNRFLPVSEPAWLASDGSLDRAVIGEFLEQCKRIYDAQMDGIREEIVEDYNESHIAYRSDEMVGDWRVNWQIANDIFDYISGESYLLSGWLDTASAYQEVTSVERAKGYENSKRIAMPGHCAQVFQPQSLLGISATSAQVDEAKDFMRFFLSAEAAAGYYDFPINQEAYEIQFIPIEEFIGEDNAYGSLVLSTSEGLYVELIVYWPSDEQIAGLKEELSSLSTPYLPDSVLENTVLIEGSNYMEGYQTLEEALDGIEKSVAIYMSE